MSSSPRRLAVLLAALLCAPALLHAQQPPLPFQDRTLPIDRRIDDLVSRMTLEEKASQMVNRTRAIPRLNVPEYNIWSEALHGVAGGGFATVFPQAIGLAATFDVPTLHEMAQATAREARVKYNQAAKAGRAGRMMGGLTFYSPNINIFRDPRWGRGQETYGEDPFLSARLGVAFITGMQGDDLDHPVVTATAKHYAVHSGPEPLRHGFDAKASAHDIEDTYLPAFRAAVVEGKVKSVMCVYNAINGVPGCASESLLDGTLREQWKFQGFVTGDCDAVRDVETGHKYAKSAAEAGAFAIKAGLDSDCTTSGLFDQGGAPDYQRYIDAAKQGLLTEAEIDVALKRMLRPRFELGLFDPLDTVKAAQVPDAELDSPAHRDLALKLARESMVLLKNDGVLPFAKAPLAHRRRRAAGRQQPRAAGQLQRLAVALDHRPRRHPEAVPEGARRLRARHHVPSARRAGADFGADHRRRAPRASKAEVFEKPDFSGMPVEKRTDAQVLVGRDRSAGSAAELRCRAARRAPDPLDRLPDAGRERHLPARRGRPRQPALPRRQEAGRPDRRLPAASERRRRDPREGSPLRHSRSSRSRAGSRPRDSSGCRRSRTRRPVPSPRPGRPTSWSPSWASPPISRARRTACSRRASRAGTAPASISRAKSRGSSRR